MRTAILALLMCVAGCVPAAFGANIYLLCVNDSPGATTCQSGDFVLYEWDGVTTGSIAPVASSGASGLAAHTSTSLGIETLSLDTGTLGTNWNIGGNAGKNNTSSAALSVMTLNLSGVTTSAGAKTLNIFYGAGNFPASDVVFGPLTQSAGGTLGAAASITLSGCAEKPSGDPTNFAACTGTNELGITPATASTEAITQLGSQSGLTGPFTTNTFSSATSFGMVQEVVLTESSSALLGDTTTGVWNINQVPEPSTFALMALAGMGLLGAGRFSRRKSVKN